MNRLAIILILLALAIPAAAQTVDVGATVVSSTNYAPPFGSQGGGNTFPAALARVSFDLPHGFEAVAKVRVSRTPQLQTQFTTDEPTQYPAAGLTIAAEGRYNSGRLFVGGGVEYSKQFFTRDNPDLEYSRSYNLNPLMLAGIRLPGRQEVSFTGVIRDRDTDLYGYRVNYGYAHPISDGISIIVGAEVSRYTFRETNRLGYRDRYYEKDTVLLFDFGLRFGKAN